ncbi:MAG: four helix bundle protein [Bacteroidota bacterium]
MSLTPEILKKRTFDFALSTLRIIDDLQKSTANDIMGRQVMRSATSVGANYRAACKAKSTADFINKLKIVEEESDESTYWLELIKAFNNLADGKFELLLKESKELERIFSASAITAKTNKIKNTQSSIVNNKIVNQ